jgi:cysteine-rich repeat protein
VLGGCQVVGHAHLVSAAIFAQRYDSDGQRVGSEFQVDTYVEGYDLYDIAPAVAMGPGRNFLIVWRHVTFSPGDAASELFGRRYDSADAPAATEFRVNAYTVGDVGDPSVAVGGDGRFVAAWASYFAPGTHSVFARRTNPSGTFVDPEFQVNRSTPATAPKLDVHPDGGIAIAWLIPDADGDEVRARTLSVACGDGATDVFEGCDDGNRSDGDCCTSSCQKELDGPASCDGNVCTRSDACLAGTCISGPCANGDPCTVCGGQCLETGLVCECTF